MQPEKGLTFRSVLLAIAMMVVIAVWTQYGEFYTKVVGVSGGSPPLGAFMAFMATLMLGRWFVSKWRWAVLDRSEVLVVYTMLLVAVPVMASGVMHFLLPVLTGQSYSAHVNDSSAQLKLLEGVPSWFAITDKDAAVGYWRGAEGVAAPGGLANIGYWLKGGVPWEHWWRPMLLAWLPLLGSLFAAMLCISALLRKQWVEAERLPFPQTVMPLAMLNSDSDAGVPWWRKYFAGRAFWIGLAVPVLIHGVNGLHHYYQAVPEIRTALRLSEVITEKPWSAITADCTFSFSPLEIGLACLITFEVGFSFLFFYGLTRLQLLWAELLGLSGFKGNSQWWSTGTFPFFEEQGIGAAVAFAFIALWMARRHLAGRIAGVLRPGRPSDAGEAMSARGALAGLVVSSLAFTIILWLAGMHPLMAAGVFGMYVCLGICIAKVRAEGGLGKQPFTDSIFFLLGGTTVFAASSLGVFNHFYLMCPGVMMVLMGVQMESFRMCDSVGLSRKAMTKALLIAFAAAFVIGAYTMLTITYRHGMVNMTSYPAFAGGFAHSQLVYDMQTPVKTDYLKLGAIGFGAAVSALLTFLRYTFMSWPLHPAGFFLSVSRASDYWSAVLIALAIKWLVLKWGGLRVYEKVYPAFIALIFGDLAMRAFWAIVATLGLLTQGQAGYGG
ncbi:MAG TPA: DUF6785 family protein [Planctomycetota bacterium]|nr:DUF6785 family protein [Planctomycetota bacterium]